MTQGRIGVIAGIALIALALALRLGGRRLLASLRRCKDEKG